jgi:LysM repeat protein
MAQLAQKLKQQATPAPHFITLDDATLERTGVDQTISAFLLRTNVLVVVDPSTIPADPPPTGFTLQGTLPTATADTFFNLTGRDCSVQFVQNGDVIDFQLAINPESEGGSYVKWQFSDSFGANAYLFNNLPITDPRFLFTTYDISQTVLTGLNFSSGLPLIGVLADVPALIGGSTSMALAAASASGGEVVVPVANSSTYTLQGLISQVAQGTTFDLQASLNTPTVDITFIQITSPFVGAVLTYEKADGGGGNGGGGNGSALVAAGDGEDTWTSVKQIYVGAGIKISNSSGTEVPLEIRAILPLTSGIPLMLFRVGPPPGFITSINDIGSLVAGNTWNEFFTGPAAQLQPYVATFGLKSFTVKVNLTKLSVISLNLEAGISEPWKFFNDMFVMEKFDVSWVIISPTTNTLQNAEISTTIVLFNNPAFTFAVDMLLPDLFISGEYAGTVSFTMADIVNEVNSFFGFSLPVPPDDMAQFSFGNFTTTIDVPGSIFTFSAIASISLNLFGLELLGLQDTYFFVTVDKSANAKVPVSITMTGTLVVLGLEFYVNAHYGETIEFEIHLVNTTVGDLLNWLVHLVDPTFDISFPSPWNKLLDISLDALVLKISDSNTKKTVSLTYETTIDLGFMTITGLGLTYTKTGTAPGAVEIALSGTFLGQQFGTGSSNPPLGWNAMNGTPPAVPGQGSSLFDLQYIGLGQHIAFTGIDFTNIQDVMKALRASVVPSQTGQLPPFGNNGLAFSSQSNWLIGAQFSVMSTVAISAIFNDPNLYGILIELSGAKAKIFAGLSFQILYRKVNDSIGVYHIELKLPDAMRNLQFGSVSITLPVVILDIYTNGNFRVDFGFPKGLDFSNSFSIQIFPFVGYGGFYFALLDGATSSRVPQITNGSFSPVIEFGFALSLGVGKTVNAGILSGGITVTVIGILQGVLGWFNPTDNSPQEVYYWIQGTVAIVGRLYATIDFAIIQASVDVTAYASVTLTIESHQPIYIAISAGVSVRVSVKIVFFTIHLSFKATISASFTIGSASATPWKLASSSPSSRNTLMAASVAPQLRGQGTLHSAFNRHAGYALAMRRALLAAPPTIVEWPAVTVLSGGAQTVTIWAMPAFTKSETVSGGADAIMLLAAQNSVDPGASTHAQQRLLYGADPASQTFNLLMQAMLGWGIYVETTRGISSASRSGGVSTITTSAPHGLAVGRGVVIAGVADASFNGTFTVASVTGDSSFTYEQSGKGDATSSGGTATATAVTAAQLLDLQWQLQQSEVTDAAFDYDTLTAFLAANFTFDVTPVTDVSTETGVAIFPMIPAIKMTDTAGVSVPFGSFNGVDEYYQEKVAAYFQLLQVQYESRNGNGGDTALKAAPDETLVSMAKVVFSRYFNMLMSSGVKAAIDFLASYPYVVGSSAMSIDDIATAVGDDSLLSYPMHVVSPNQDLAVLNTGAVIELPAVVYQIRTSDTFASVAATFNAQGALNMEGAPYTSGDLLAANLDTTAIFNIGTPLPVSGIGYVTQASDTLNLIATRMMVRAAGSPLLTTILNLQPMVQTLLGLNPSITDPNAPIVGVSTVTLADGGSYSVVPGDTLTLIAAYGLAFEQALVGTSNYVTDILQANPGLTVTDPSAQQPVNTSIAMPSVTRSIASVDTIASLAVTLITTVPIVEASILALPTTTVLLAPQGVLKVPLTYAILKDDTFSGIGSKFDLEMEYLAAQAVGTVPSSGPKIFAAGMAITILDLAAIEVSSLMEGLLTQSEWNNTSGMVSRFLLSGLRLPDPNAPYFKSLTVADLSDPAKLGPIVTAPMFGLTGQQYPIAVPAPDGYQITLQNDAGVSWLNFSGQGSTSFGLTADQQTMLSEIATTPLDPQIETLTRLSLFQMVPPRIALQEHITWQAAVRPSGCLGGGAVTGNPSIWLFPDPLVLQIEASSAATPGTPLLYEVVVSKHTDPSKPVTAEQAGCYAWGTVVDFTVSLPTTSDPSVANAYVIGGADDVGAELLRDLYTYLAGGSDGATLYLLYSPNPSSSNASGLISDQLNAGSTYILKTNLSTLTHSGNEVMLAAMEVEAAPDPTKVYSASLSDPADFIALLWQASITRSGGFYMNYVNQNGGAALPPSVFGTETTATLSLLVVLDSQAASRDARMQPFNNCAVVGDNIDTTVSSLFVQPATYLVVEGDSLTTAATNFNAAWGTSFTMLDGATFNQSIPLLLEVGALLTIPGQGTPYEIAYGDTLASIVAKFSLPNLSALVNAGSNATAAILSVGTEMQFANGTLQPATTAPAGTIGFEITRTNPDPDSLPYDQLQPAQMVGNLFNLVGFSLAAVNGFVKSGAGLPTTPADSLQEGTDGLEERDADAVSNANWYYSQTIAVGPFGNPQYGSSSAALPGVEWNPYNGIINGATLNHARIELDLQDIYGNIQQLPSQYASIDVPVGYFDDIVSLASWPSLAASYEIAGSPVAVSIGMTMQQSRYIPSLSVPVSSALAAIAADLASYTTIYYQLAQPDLSFALQTTLALDSSGTAPLSYALSKTPFFAFAYGAYVYLAALATMKGVQLTITGGATSVLDVTKQYGATPEQLFETNQESLYESLFGTALLNVPEMYTTVQDDTLDTIVAKQSAPAPTVEQLAEWNAGTALYAGIDLIAPQERTTTAKGTDDLNGVAARAHASVTALAQANETDDTILSEGVILSVGAASYQLGKNDTLANAALHLDATVADVATANQWIAGLFVENATLKVHDILIDSGDTFTSLAATYTGGDIDALATANAAVENVFAPGTAVRVGWKTSVVGPQLSDTLTTFATANGVTVDQLAAANNLATTLFVDGAQVDVPGVMTNTSPDQYCTYTAASSDTLTKIAAKFGATPEAILDLNADIPGLLASGQTIKDTTSGKSVVTITGDTFDTVIARFKTEEGVTVSPAQLAGDVATQESLIIAGSLWICPPMRGDAHGLNTALSLQGLATAYNTDSNTLGVANAAAIGFLASGVAVTIGSVTVTTNGSTTLNALVNAVTPIGLGLDDVIIAIAATPNLIASSASVVPVPPPSPLGNGAIIAPHFVAPVFQLTMEVVTARVDAYIDPDFKTVRSVSTSIYGVPPEPDQENAGTSYTFTKFATDLQAAIPGLHVATGDPVTEGDSPNLSTFWGVNFGSSAGPAITYTFNGGSNTQYFAIPPLSTALMGGTVPIQPYISGQGLVGPTQSQTFQAVDLDVWLNTFLGAIDVFLSPPYAVPAFALDPTDTVQVVQQKGPLAQAISNRLQYVLQVTPQGSMDDAKAAIYQAMLTELSSAFTVDTLVQVPVTVDSPYTDPLAAPRLSGKIAMADNGAPSGDQSPSTLPSAYSFSTAKVALTKPGSTATFLFSVKSPADHREANLNLQYDITELEIPDPTSIMGDYEGSSWLKFILDIETSGSTIGEIDIPIPLRSYPSPVTLLSQSAKQSVAEPASAADLLGWDFGFIYQHDDAEQDTPLVAITFNAAGGPVAQAAPGSSLNLNLIFAALAQFMAVYPVLKDDIATLPSVVPGTQNPTALAAVQTFRTLVDDVVEAWYKTLFAAAFNPPPVTYYYQMQKDQAIDGTLTTLTITSVDPNSGQAVKNPTVLWPDVYITDQKTKLALVSSDDLHAVYNYPANIPASTPLIQEFIYTWGQTGESNSLPAASPAQVPDGLVAVAPQTFTFKDVNIIAQQNGRAGVSITRNLVLVRDRSTGQAISTNSAFIYQTPLTKFTSNAIASNYAGNDMTIGYPPNTIAKSLGDFFNALLNSENTWSSGDTINIRFSAAYSYALATSDGGGSGALAALVPIMLVPSYSFDPTTDYKTDISTSFVNQVEAVITEWQKISQPSTTNGAYQFDLIVYASQGQLQPLIQATGLQYLLAAPGGA